MKYTVIGSNGGVGAAIIDELLSAGADVAGVTLSGRDKYGRNYPVVKANALVLDELIRATVGSDVIFGAFNASEYTTDSWAEEFPVFMNNFIEVGKKTAARLVFIDNLYCYTDLEGKAKYLESTHCVPSTNMGATRLGIAWQFIEAATHGVIRGNIVRGSDLYGPYSLNSLIGDRFFEGLLKKNSAEMLPLGRGLHSFTFTRDFAKAAVILSNSDRNAEIFHVLNAAPVSYESLVLKTVAIVGTDVKVARMPWPMLWIAQFFVPPVKSMLELSYEFKHDFIVDSEKIQSLEPNYRPTELQAGLEETVKWFRNFMEHSK